jgi:phospholipase C
MKPAKLFLTFLSLFALSLLTACGGSGNNNNDNGGNGSGGGGNNASINSVNHVVILMQENRSFDSYFGKLNDYRVTRNLGRDVDGLPDNASNIGYDGVTKINAFHLATECIEDLSPAWNESHLDWNLKNPTSDTPTLDGFAYTAGKFATDENNSGGGTYTDTLGARAMGYYTSDDLGYYYFMATQFATSDRWFTPIMSRTQPNRMYLLAATSQGYAFPPTAPLTAKTIFQALDEANVSWKIYVTYTGGTYLTYFDTYYQQHQANIVPATQFAADAQNGTLPAVALIESGYESGQDEHPNNPVQKGMMYSASFINALLQSPSWKDSVFFLTFDEAGGIYDHVAPVATVNPDGLAPKDLSPTDIAGDFTRTGFRIPLIVISPFAKQGYVSHTNADYTAMLKFIETRWKLAALTKRDAAQPDMTEFFDWSAPNATAPTPPTPQETLRCTPGQLQ